jgi:hypothetical protein
MKSLINTVIFICCLVFIIAESSCDNGPDFGNNNNNNSNQSQVENCWIVKSRATQLPINGARINIVYDYPGSKLGPFLNYSSYSDENGKTCALFPSTYSITSFSAFAPGYKAWGLPFGPIPTPIFLDPLE